MEDYMNCKNTGAHIDPTAFTLRNRKVCKTSQTEPLCAEDEMLPDTLPRPPSYDDLPPTVREVRF